MKNTFVIIFITSFSIVGFGQRVYDDYAVNFKLGAYSEMSKSEGGLCIGLDYDMIKQKNVFTVGFNGGSAFNIALATRDNIRQLYFLYGRFLDIENNLYRFQYQIGLAPTFGVVRGDFLYRESGWFGEAHYEEFPFFTLGIPIKLGFKIMPNRLTSIGIDVMANFNTRKSVVIPMLSIEIFGSRNKKMRIQTD